MTNIFDLLDLMTLELTLDLENVSSKLLYFAGINITFYELVILLSLERLWLFARRVGRC